MKNRKICVFTGTRAEYGLLKPLMDEIRNDKRLSLQLIVSGMHLSSEFGTTYKEIEKDGFIIDEEVKILSGCDTPAAISKSIGLCAAGLGRAYEKLQPHIAVILGDRFEAFAAAAAAMVARIPIAHISGGEATFGLIDEAFRHSITKMSHLHFVATEKYRKRVIQLGEDPGRVFNFGALAIDNVRNLKLLSREELSSDIGFDFGRHNVAVTFHPVTLENNTSGKQFSNLLTALDGLTDTHMIFTKANADTGGRVINAAVERYAANNPKKAKVFSSLGQIRYLSVLKHVDAVIGNSSSGIIEAPSLRIATINIGDRQKGRIKAKSVIDCEPTAKSIRMAIDKAYSEKFRGSLDDVVNPYGDGNAAGRILRVLENYDMGDILKKRFYEIDFKHGGQKC